MRRFEFKSFVVPLVLAAFLLPVLLVLLQGDVLPCTHDNIFHSYRIVAMREMLRFGWLFSRWVPNLALGYGYPFFNYREPLPYLVAEAVFAMGTPLPLVLGGIYAGSLIAAAWGAYVLARDLFGERAGWVAAVSYGLAPYMLLDVLRRGNMPESIGLAMLPWLFVSTRRLILSRSRRSFVVTTLLLSALFLSHNISSLLLAPFLGVYVVLLAWLHRERKAWPYAFLAVGIAVLLTAWFWLPALTEQDMVQLHLSRSTRNNDFHYNFLTWREMLFSLPAPYDPDYLNSPMRVSLGVVQAGLAAVGVVICLARGRRREQRWLVGLFLAASALYLWMATPDSVWLWEAVPLFSFMQFPWRLVGRALLPVSLLAGLAVQMICEWWETPLQLSPGGGEGGRLVCRPSAPLGGRKRRGSSGGRMSQDRDVDDCGETPLRLSPGGGEGGWSVSAGRSASEGEVIRRGGPPLPLSPAGGEGGRSV
ncbi:MAG: 6-pyruvoyl-tetrahydropterin synthase-related protein, partial [Anaerolineae bacterium]|nr:6-pyruvoyl-tetrahydropterin synthase-related protein [Anaerolineae bacterium]